MCRAASFIVTREYKVFFHPTKDSHQDIIDYHKLYEGNNRINLVPVEISPPNMNFNIPFDKWVFLTDLKETPDWYDTIKAEKAVRAELPNWFKKLEGANLKEISNPVNPFKIKPKKLSEKDAKELVNQWASVWASVWNSVWNSVGGSVGGSVRASVGTSVWNSVGDSVRASIGDSVRASVGGSVWGSVWGSVRDSVWGSVKDSVGGYIGGLFPHITEWKYAEKLGKNRKNPWKPLQTLWYKGYVPSFDGKVWRLHCGKKAEVKYQWTKEELEK